MFVSCSQIWSADLRIRYLKEGAATGCFLFSTHIFSEKSYPLQSTVKPLWSFRTFACVSSNCRWLARAQCAVFNFISAEELWTVVSSCLSATACSELMNWKIYRVVKDQVILPFKYSGSLTWYRYRSWKYHECQKLKMMSGFSFMASYDFVLRMSCWRLKQCPWFHNTTHPQFLWCDVSAPFLFAWCHSLAVFMRWTYLTRDSLQHCCVVSPHSFFFLVYASSAYDEFVKGVSALQSKHKVLLPQPSRHIDWSGTLRILFHWILHPSILFCQSECTLLPSVNQRCPGESVRHHCSATSCFPCLVLPLPLTRPVDQKNQLLRLYHYSHLPT